MDLFNIIGPVMVGPSSSHTAGAVKIGLISRLILDSEPLEAKITFYGSFASTYIGHGTDKAIISGILGLSPDDERIRDIFELAKQYGLKYSFSSNSRKNVSHPNTVKIELTSKNGNKCEVTGVSIGGSKIVINQVNKLKVSFDGEHDTLIVMHKDYPGMIVKVTSFFADNNLNICSFRLSRKERGGTAVMTIETDNSIPKSILSGIKSIENIEKCILCKKLEGIVSL